MPTMPPDDVAAMFDLPPLPTAAPSTREPDDEALQAAEAELAAELASTIDAGLVATDAPDSRTDLRVDVAWPARMHLPDGHVIELKVRNISEGGVGLVSDERIPADTLVSFEMDVPPFDASATVTSIKGTLKTSYTVAQGSEILCGGTWEEPPAGLALVNRWITRLRL